MKRPGSLSYKPRPAYNHTINTRDSFSPTVLEDRERAFKKKLATAYWWWCPRVQRYKDLFMTLASQQCSRLSLTDSWGRADLGITNVVRLRRCVGR